MGRRRVRKSRIEVKEILNPSELVTVDADDVADPVLYKGEFVRLVPAAGMTADEVNAIRIKLLEGGARAVRSLPVQKVEDAVAESSGKVLSDDRSMRAVVFDRLDRAQNITDVDDVRAALEEALGSAGL